MSYLIVMLLPMALGAFAQWKIKSAYAKTSQIPASSGLTGAEVAQRILDESGINGVGIEESHGHLSDHYDPKAKMLRLSKDVYHGSSLASLGIAAHEVGHAIQDAKKYSPLVLRNGIVPLANFGSKAGLGILMVGASMGSTKIAVVGLVAFSLIVLFQLINLPVEFDASSRAKKILLNSGFISNSEHKQVSGVLSAAAMTYVAGTVSAIATLMYYVMRSGVLNRR